MDQVAAGIDMLNPHQVKIKSLAREGPQQWEQNQKQRLFRPQLLTRIIHSSVNSFSSFVLVLGPVPWELSAVSINYQPSTIILFRGHCCHSRWQAFVSQDPSIVQLGRIVDSWV